MCKKTNEPKKNKKQKKSIRYFPKANYHRWAVVKQCRRSHCKTVVVDLKGEKDITTSFVIHSCGSKSDCINIFCHKYPKELAQKWTLSIETWLTINSSIKLSIVEIDLKKKLEQTESHWTLNTEHACEPETCSVTFLTLTCGMRREVLCCKASNGTQS